MTKYVPTSSVEAWVPDFGLHAVGILMQLFYFFLLVFGYCCLWFPNIGAEGRLRRLVVRNTMLEDIIKLQALTF